LERRGNGVGKKDAPRRRTGEAGGGVAIKLFLPPGFSKTSKKGGKGHDGGEEGIFGGGSYEIKNRAVETGIEYGASKKKKPEPFQRWGENWDRRTRGLQQTSFWEKRGMGGYR